MCGRMEVRTVCLVHFPVSGPGASDHRNERRVTVIREKVVESWTKTTRQKICDGFAGKSTVRGSGDCVSAYVHTRHQGFL